MDDSPSSALAGYQQTSWATTGGRVSLDEHQLAVATVQQAGLEAVAALDAASIRAVMAKNEVRGCSGCLAYHTFCIPVQHPRLRCDEIAMMWVLDRMGIVES